MSADAECQECRRSVPEDELAEGDDGRLLCCCCRLKESEEELAEKDVSGRGTAQDQKAAEPVREVRVNAPHGMPPPETDSGTWASTY